MFERLALPTPFQVGPVNAYLAGRTVVDPGPDSEDALAELEAGLDERDLALGDVEQVLVTHPHPDHFGLAYRLREHGATVLASPAARPILEDFEGRLDYEQSYFSALFEAHGMSPETAQTVTQLPEAFVEYAPSTTIDRGLTGGDRVGIDGGSVTVREVDGHSVGELAFEFGPGASEDLGPTDDADAGPDDDGASSDDADAQANHDTDDGADGEFAAIVGDHVLPDTTPNPFLQPPPSDDGSFAVPEDDGPAALDDLRPHRLVAFNASLERLRAVGHDRFLPGHGERVEDPQRRIDEILAAHEERTAATLALLDGPTTAVEVLRGLFEDLPVIDYFPGMSEALGHLDVLVERGEAVRVERDGELAYEPA